MPIICPSMNLGTPILSVCLVFALGFCGVSVVPQVANSTQAQLICYMDRDGAYDFGPGYRLIKQKEYTEAVDYYQTHLNLPWGIKRPAILNNYAWSLAKLGKVDESILLADEAVETAGSRLLSYTYGTRGYAYMKKGNFEQALRDLSTSLELNPSCGIDRYLISVVYKKLGKTEESREQLQIAQKLGFSWDEPGEFLPAKLLPSGTLL